MFNTSLLLFLTFYQKWLKGFLPPSCVFEPSCSEYTKQAILKYGAMRGILKGLQRLLLCHPFSGRLGHYPLE